MIRAPTLRRAVPSRGQARSVQNQAGAADTGSARTFATSSSAHERASVAKLERGSPSATGRADGVAEGVRLRSFHQCTAEVLPPIGDGMRSALLVMAFGGVARERVSAFTPPDSASRADL